MSDNEKQSDAPQEPISKLDIVAIELRRAREAKGISHSELHRKTGISRTVLFGYETGRTKPGAKELRLLSESLGVSPNRLLFGTDEPFKPQTGIRALAKLRNSPISLIIGMMLFPAAFSVLDDDQIESLLTILSSMVESRDRETHKKITVAVELISEEMGDGSPEALSAFLKRAQAPGFQEEWGRRINERLK